MDGKAVAQPKSQHHSCALRFPIASGGRWLGCSGWLAGCWLAGVLLDGWLAHRLLVHGSTSYVLDLVQYYMYLL